VTPSAGGPGLGLGELPTPFRSFRRKEREILYNGLMALQPDLDAKRPGGSASASSITPTFFQNCVEIGLKKHSWCEQRPFVLRAKLRNWAAQKSAFYAIAVHLLVFLAAAHSFRLVTPQRFSK
jgi:hypothetical protein